MCKYANVQVCQCAIVRMCKFAIVQVCKCERLQMCNYAHVQVCLCVSMKMCKYENVQVCKFASIQLCQQVRSVQLWAHDLWRSALFLTTLDVNCLHSDKLWKKTILVGFHHALFSLTKNLPYLRTLSRRWRHFISWLLTILVSPTFRNFNVFFFFNLTKSQNEKFARTKTDRHCLPCPELVHWLACNFAPTGAKKQRDNFLV